MRWDTPMKKQNVRPSIMNHKPKFWYNHLWQHRPPPRRCWCSFGKCCHLIATTLDLNFVLLDWFDLLFNSSLFLYNAFFDVLVCIEERLCDRCRQLARKVCRTEKEFKFFWWATLAFFQSCLFFRRKSLHKFEIWSFWLCTFIKWRIEYHFILKTKKE